MKTTEIYPPLKVVQDQPFKELASWEEIENIRLMLTSLGKRWQENIYLPTRGIAIGVQMLKDITATKNMLFGASIVLAALASWRRYKEVYRFAPELEMLLYGQARECKLPIGVLQYLRGSKRGSNNIHTALPERSLKKQKYLWNEHTCYSQRTIRKLYPCTFPY